jgi:hypothetical protein
VGGKPRQLLRWRRKPLGVRVDNESVAERDGYRFQVFIWKWQEPQAWAYMVDWTEDGKRKRETFYRMASERGAKLAAEQWLRRRAR